MAGFRNILATLIVTSVLWPSLLVAQAGIASSVHRVSVTVPPLVKVQISARRVSSVGVPSAPGAQGLAVSVTASQPWILSIGAPAKRSGRRVTWSLNQKKGFSSVSRKPATLASGGSGITSAGATVYLQSDEAASEESDSEAPVVLTVIAR